MPLLSRSFDPLLAVFTGGLAYYLSETNPRTAPPPNETLRQLLLWKQDKWRKERDARDAVLESGVVDSAGKVGNV
ncbi:hypothetical protein M422DRAFT_30248 [Sphaerobolus stellatus SS14]|uniref:Uncharacterized protein n=1 Tax=Sphaerobolus stellatus (strain SS14) TaxID=990650 RepID=A0A0C9W068_SPHS4|nr:hypothetical protein M422DRAFT_30248 [Sphaerobolus stellatus SS14]